MSSCFGCQEPQALFLFAILLFILGFLVPVLFLPFHHFFFLLCLFYYSSNGLYFIVSVLFDVSWLRFLLDTGGA